MPHWIILPLLFTPCHVTYDVTQVDSEWDAGNYDRAREASRMARIWGYITAILGSVLVFVPAAIIISIYIIVLIVGSTS